MTARTDLRLKQRTQGLLAWTLWDGVSVLAGLAHLGLLVFLIVGFGDRPLWGNLCLGALYAYAIGWNLNSVAHNFIHTPYFRSAGLNRLFSLCESLAIGFSQTYYRWIHLRHHSGNSDRPGPDGETVDWLSIYRHGKDGQPESVWSYTFLSFFRDDLGEVHRAIAVRDPAEARFGRIELGAFAALALAAAVYDWRAVLFLVPFYYLGHCLSSLNGYYEHFNGDPDQPIAWGVSTYAPLYNLLWFFNGHHAEHHYRPAVHWTRLPALRRQIEDQQKLAGLHVIGPAHALGFLARANRERPI